MEYRKYVLFFLALLVRSKTSLVALSEALKADHGFNVESRAIRDLIEIMADYDAPTRRSYLQFITGSPKLPIGGTCTSSHPVRAVLFTVFLRLQGPQPSSHRRPQAARSPIDRRRLPSECHDVRQLSQAARVLVEEGNGREARGRHARGCRQFPLVMKNQSFRSVLSRTSSCSIPSSIICAFIVMSSRSHCLLTIIRTLISFACYVHWFLREVRRTAPRMCFVALATTR